MAKVWQCGNVPLVRISPMANDKEHLDCAHLPPTALPAGGGRGGAETRQTARCPGPGGSWPRPWAWPLAPPSSRRGRGLRLLPAPAVGVASGSSQLRRGRGLRLLPAPAPGRGLRLLPAPAVGVASGSSQLRRGRGLGPPSSRPQSPSQGREPWGARSERRLPLNPPGP